MILKVNVIMGLWICYPALCSVMMVICADCQACMCFREPITGSKSFVPTSPSHSKITSNRNLPVNCKTHRFCHNNLFDHLIPSFPKN